MKNKRGSLTVVALGFLLLISGLLCYQLSIYHSKMALNRSLIHEYRVKSTSRDK